MSDVPVPSATRPATPVDLGLASDRRLVLIALGLLLVPLIWFLRADLHLFAGTQLRERFAIRGLLIATMLVGLQRVATATTRVAYARRVFGVSLATAVMLTALIAQRPMGAAMPLRVPLLFLALFYAAIPNSAWRQIAPPLLLSAALVVLRMTRLTGGAESDIAGDVLILLVMNGAGVLLVRRRLALEADMARSWAAEHEARQARERVLADLKTLRGIIPICAHCKKVRTGVGDWQQIERYVRDHSEAQFSHGICPDCERSHYTE